MKLSYYQTAVACCCLFLAACGVTAEQCEYDYVVVGSGIGGSVFARRAAEQGHRVAILERGVAVQTSGPFDFGAANQPPFVTDDTRIPKMNPFSLYQGTDTTEFGVTSLPVASLNDEVTEIFHGNMQGGGSSINAMIWERAERGWPAMWDPAAEEIAYGLAEEVLHIEQDSFQTYHSNAIIQAAEAAGLKDFVKRTKLPRRDGIRQDAFTAYVLSAEPEILERITMFT